MPGFLDITQQTLVGSAQGEIVENARFLDELLGSLKIMTLMLSRMQPISDLAAKLASTEYSVDDIQLGGAIIARLYYNNIYGRPANFNYDMKKLREVYEMYDIPWDEAVN
jgi:hypothetical protein